MDWEEQEIVALYDVLAHLSPSPVVQLNRAVAVGMRDGPQAGLAALGVPPDSALYDTFLLIAKWIIAPADPVNAGAYLTRDTGSAGGIRAGDG